MSSTPMKYWRGRAVYKDELMRLLSVVHALHGGRALGAEVVVQGVAGHQQQVCTQENSSHHVNIGVVGDGVDVRRRFQTTTPFIRGDHLGGVDRQPLVRVDRHAEEAGVGLQAAGQHITYTVGRDHQPTVPEALT
ncbi:hypothetical protein EYF80_016609 [Liparis tanakae]|uniref:Uncharacterized protein n=1 Tax=Liparis tanakae TaxID=230148 RepID=A0A4Z2I7H6_9TELE|nr:hypothetical protein EYF80_016609 [Liparis tanakae]